MQPFDSDQMGILFISTIFGYTIIATAILDRLLHDSTTINIRDESYRLKDRRRAGLLPQRSKFVAKFVFAFAGNRIE